MAGEGQGTRGGLVAGMMVVLSSDGNREVVIAAVISINEGKMPTIGRLCQPQRMVVPAWLYALTLCLMKDSSVSIAKWGNADQGSGEGWHDVALAGRWREVLELELGTGGGACNGAVSDANADAGDRGVAVVDRSVLTEVDAGGAVVGYSGVVDGKVG